MQRERLGTGRSDGPLGPAKSIFSYDIHEKAIISVKVRFNLIDPS
jgi:hypothetical protein